MYKDLRRKYIYDVREYNKEEQLFLNSSTDVIRAVAMLLYHVFKRRREAADDEFAVI